LKYFRKQWEKNEDSCLDQLMAVWKNPKLSTVETSVKSVGK